MASGTMVPLLTDETCDPVIGGRITLLPIHAQRWLAYCADSELAGWTIRVIVSHVT